MQRARENAIEDASAFGMKVNLDAILHCDRQGTMMNNRPPKPIEEILLEEIHSRDVDDCRSNINPSSPFVEIEYRRGCKKQVRKLTLVWLLSESKDSLSNDRLSRVQGSKKTLSCKRRLNFEKQRTNANLKMIKFKLVIIAFSIIKMSYQNTMKKPLSSLWVQ